MTETATLNPNSYRSRVAMAEAYVRSRFYPPLPVKYGRLAVEAVDACNSGEPEMELFVGDLPIVPRDTFEDAEGDQVVRADALVANLRLEYMLEDDCDPCEGTGTLEKIDPMIGEAVAEKDCPYCGGSGRI